MRIYHLPQQHVLPPVRMHFAAFFAAAFMLVFIISALPLIAKEGAGLVDTSAQNISTPDAMRQTELVYLVRQDCGSCHGMTLKGGLGKPLLPTDVKDTPVEALVSIILDGIPDTPMPPWRGLLSETDAEWIARQLKKGLPQ